MIFVLFFQSCSNQKTINNDLETKNSSTTLRNKLSETIDFIPWTEPVVFSEPDINWSSFGSKTEELVFLGNPKRVLPSVLELGVLDDSFSDKNIISVSKTFFENLKDGKVLDSFPNSNFDSIKVVLENKKQNGPFEKYISSNPSLLSDGNFQIDCLFFNKETI